MTAAETSLLFHRWRTRTEPNPKFWVPSFPSLVVIRWTRWIAHWQQSPKPCSLLPIRLTAQMSWVEFSQIGRCEQDLSIVV